MNNENDSRSILKILKIIIIAVVVVMIIVPILVNLLLFVSIPTATDLGNKEWIGFWGSYIGGCFGGLCTLITIYLTIHYYEKQEIDHKTELAMQMKRHDEEMKTELLRKYRPILILRPNGGSGFDGQYNHFFLHASNLSEFAAINVIIDGVYEPKIDKEAEMVMNIKSVNQKGGYNDILMVHAGDVVGHEYIWKYKLEVLNDIVEANGKKPHKYYYKMVEETVK